MQKKKLKQQIMLHCHISKFRLAFEEKHQVLQDFSGPLISFDIDEWVNK